VDPAAELALAHAAAAGDDAAIREFEARYVAPLRPALRAMAIADDDIAEIEQSLRVKLLVAVAGEPARVIGYAGQGTLGGLVRVAAVREALTLLKRRRATTSDDDLAALASPGDDPELLALKARHREAFKAAFEEAVRRLEPRQRSMLRLSLLEQRSIDKIGAAYGVHRATAARWIEGAKEALRIATRKVLAERLDLGDAELEGAIALIESRIELSMDRLLATAGS
jgi:RNA polymerase sigma-70 factor, ECF subfamily